MTDAELRLVETVKKIYGAEVFVDACEKQIPKKVRTNNMRAVCPRCDELFESTHWLSGGDTYCENCGQHVLWEDE